MVRAAPPLPASRVAVSTSTFVRWGWGWLPAASLPAADPLRLGCVAPAAHVPFCGLVQGGKSFSAATGEVAPAAAAAGGAAAVPVPDGVFTKPPFVVGNKLLAVASFDQRPHAATVVAVRGEDEGPGGAFDEDAGAAGGGGATRAWRTSRQYEAGAAARVWEGRATAGEREATRRAAPPTRRPLAHGC